MPVKKKKLGDRIRAGLVQLKGNDESAQVFSIVCPDVLSYEYHYDDVYNQLGKFLCISECDDNGKITKKAACCKIFKKRQDRVLLLVIHYEGSKKKYRQYADGKIKYLSITAFKYNDLCKQLDEAGISFEDAATGACDIVLKSEDAAHGKISFDIIDSDESALWKETPELKKLVKDAQQTWEDDILASLPNEYSEEELLRLVEEAKEAGEAPEGVEDSASETPKKKKSNDQPKSKKKVEKDLDDEFDEDDEDDEEEKPKKKKKSVKEQIEEEDFDNEDLDEEDEDEDDDDDLDEDEK